MLTNPHQFLTQSPFIGASSLNVTQLDHVKRQQLDQACVSDDEDEESSVASTIDQQQDGTDHTEAPPTPPPPMLRQQPAFSTTVASIFGYEPATDYQALTLNHKQRRLSLNGEIMSKFINKERYK